MILISTFLFKSPSSYPKNTSFVLIADLILIALSTPTHPKNWLTVLDEYVIILSPDSKVPVVPNPTVLSTVITDDPIETGFIFDVLGWILNVPSIRSLSSKPTNSPNLK